MIMKRILFICSIIFALMSITSCDDDLDLQPLDQFADGAVWDEDPALIEAFVNFIYNGFGQTGVRVMMSTYVDETMLTFGWSADEVTRSLITPSNYSRFNNTADQSGFFVWENIYSKIRACNVFFGKIDEAKAVDDTQRELLKGEVYFLRAYLYHMLVAVYGGVPIIEKAYTLNDDYYVPRDSFEDCINFIVDDLDKAAARLTNDMDKGRPTKGAALALKSRVLIRAASDLYNCNASWTSGYSNPELVGYVGGDRSSRWQQAKAVAKEVIDMGIYSLHKAEPSASEDIATNYGEMFLLMETSEDIFCKYYVQNIVTTLVMPALNNGPCGWHLRGANTPIGQFVDAFEMNDGSKFSWNNPEHKANPYENREPRFYASILYDGAVWRERPDDVQSLDPIGVVQTSFKETWNASTNSIEVIPGLDTRQSPTDDWNGSYTGYYLRKGCDPSMDARFTQQVCPYRYIRYSEVVLNYAEACIELGEEEEARKYINMIRKRAGLPFITVSGEALKEAYRHERRIELAFEDHRFFDVRRWMIAPDVYKDVQAVDIQHKLNDDKVTTTAEYTVLPSVQARDWKNRFYFLPIKLDEMNRNDRLIQNPEY